MLLVGPVLVPGDGLFFPLTFAVGSHVSFLSCFVFDVEASDEIGVCYCSLDSSKGKAMSASPAHSLRGDANGRFSVIVMSPDSHYGSGVTFVSCDCA